MVVKTNMQALNANRQLNITANEQAKSTEKLSSGYRINRAADDAAGLSISEKMRVQMRGLTQASRNAQDGISFVQTAEGALGEVTDMLQRMNELAVQAANGTNTTVQRSYINSEINALKEEIDRIGEDTRFNGIDAFGTTIDFQVGSQNTSAASIKISTAELKTGGDNGLTVGASTKDAETEAADTAQTSWDNAVSDYNTAMEDAAAETDAATREGLEEAALEAFETATHDGLTESEFIAHEVALEVTGGSDASVLTQQSAREFIELVQADIETVSKMRSDLGAVQNRLEYSIKNLDNVVENTTSAESRIRDTDMSTEMVAYSNNNILQQAGQAMLAQANQANQGVLSLL